MKLRTKRLRRGARLYHGTSAKINFAIPDGPAWFSDAAAVAERFKGRHTGPRPRVVSYWVAESPELLHIRSRADFDAFEDETGVEMPDTPLDMAEAVCSAGWDGWIIPTNYPDGADILLCDPERWLATEPPARQRRRVSSRRSAP